MSDSFAAIHSPEHVALRREAGIAGAMLASGVTLLGKADAWHHAVYNAAFFDLSVGFERLAKLIVVVDHAANHDGTFPDNKTLKDHYRHDLRSLLDYAEGLAPKYLAGHEYGSTPGTDIHRGVIEVLSDFARSTRYYNLDTLTQGNASSKMDPIAAWYQRVGLPILQKHYSKRQRANDAEMASFLEATIADSIFVLNTQEDGTSSSSLGAASINQSQAEVIGKYGRFYTLQIVRHLAFLLWEVQGEAHKHRLEKIPFLHEFFVVFMGPDEQLKRYRKWSIYDA